MIPVLVGRIWHVAAAAVYPRVSLLLVHEADKKWVLLLLLSGRLAGRSNFKHSGPDSNNKTIELLVTYGSLPPPASQPDPGNRRAKKSAGMKRREGERERGGEEAACRRTGAMVELRNWESCTGEEEWREDGRWRCRRDVCVRVCVCSCVCALPGWASTTDLQKTSSEPIATPPPVLR